MGTMFLWFRWRDQVYYLGLPSQGLGFPAAWLHASASDRLFLIRRQRHSVIQSGGSA